MEIHTPLPSAATARGNQQPAVSAGTPATADDVLVSILVRDFGSLIETARTQVAVTVNAALSAVYWEIGRRIGTEVLRGSRAEYGARIIVSVGRELEVRYGRGFSEKNIYRMVQFCEVFSDRDAVAALWRQLGWTHFKSLIPIKDPLKREFYAEMCRVERWSSRTLNAKIRGMLFERTALSKKPEELIRQELAALREHDEVVPDLVLQDPYILDFLGLADAYREKDFEAAILREIERFLLELGSNFTFVARQKRITLDGKDYFIDLLLYHRPMRRLVVIELKIGDFRPGDSGQMELYLRWLDRHERQPGEQSPLGIILCGGKNRETVEYLDLGSRGIHVAQYITDLPPREILEDRLHRAIEEARRKFASCGEDEARAEGAPEPHDE